MSGTRRALQEVASNVDESMGIRKMDQSPRLSPVASAKDIGRTPSRNYGRLDINRIIPDPHQPRTQFDSNDIKEMAASLERTGQLQPIGVRWNGAKDRWIVITGERRFRAAQMAGLETIDCYFESDELSEAKKLEIQLVENLQRKNLAPLDEARGYQNLMATSSWNGKQVAEAVAVSPSRVSRALALLDLPAEVQDQLESGEISASAAYELCKLDSAEVQAELASQAAAGTLTQRKASKAVRQRKGKATKPRNLRQTFFSENGIKVTVTANRKANYHEIEEALTEAIEEVQHRINNGRQLF